MAKKLYEESRIAAIAEKIREKTGTDETYTTAEMPGGVEAVYEAGAASGGGNTEAAYNEGYADGQQAEHDRFWDTYQQNGNRTAYQGGFAGAGWNKDTFKPKYPVTINTTSGADNMFMYCNRGNTTDGTDDLLDFTEFNSLFDFSGSGRLQQTFYNARIKNLYVDGSKATAMNNTFNADNGGYIENLTLKVTATTTSFGATFSYQYHMKNITFTDDSVIAANIQFNHCTGLTKASITSIINALSSSTSGKTLTLSKTAKEAAFTADEWSALIATKSNWTISLA